MSMLGRGRLFQLSGGAVEGFQLASQHNAHLCSPDLSPVRNFISSLPM